MEVLHGPTTGLPPTNTGTAALALRHCFRSSTFSKGPSSITVHSVSSDVATFLSATGEDITRSQFSAWLLIVRVIVSLSESNASSSFFPSWPSFPSSPHLCRHPARSRFVHHLLSHHLQWCFLRLHLHLQLPDPNSSPPPLRDTAPTPSPLTSATI